MFRAPSYDNTYPRVVGYIESRFIIFVSICRFEQFEHYNPGETTSVCIVSSLSDNATVLDPYGCETVIAPSVYLHTVYIGLACIPGSIILPLFVHKLGAKFFLSTYQILRGAKGFTAPVVEYYGNPSVE